MIPMDYKEIKDFEGIEICGLRGLFTNCRVDSKSLPEGIKKLSIRHGDGWDDDDDWFCTLEERVMVNHLGDFVTTEDINTQGFYRDIEGDYTFLDIQESNELKRTILNLL